MQNNIQLSVVKAPQLQIQDFSQLLARYQSLGLAQRAEKVLQDAAPALLAAERILAALMHNENAAAALESLRKNQMLLGKMRPSDARGALMDPTNNFLELTRHKLAAWEKIMQRLAQGEGITKVGGHECIAEESPLGMAIAGNNSVSTYISMVQLIWSELAKIDPKRASDYTAHVSETRRCSTVLSDFENAASLTGKH